MLYKNKLHSLLNILGLSLALSICFLIISHIEDELSYDRSYSKSDRIYRHTIKASEGDIVRHWATIAPTTAEYLQNYFPEIEKVVRLYNLGDIKLMFEKEGEEYEFQESRILMADSTIFDVFDINLISGFKEKAFEHSYAVVLSRSIAKKLFGNVDPIGKVIYMDIAPIPLQVTGIFEDVTFKTHLQYDALLPYGVFKEMIFQMGLQDLYYSKTWAGLYTYILLKDNTSVDFVRSKMDDFEAFFYEDLDESEQLISLREMILQPISKIHLHSKLEQDSGNNSDILYVYLFTIVLILILIIATVNYVNISTAQSLKRMKEVAIRKVAGAWLPQIRFQFLSESLIITFIAGLLAILFVDIFLPYYNQYADNNLTIGNVFILKNIIIFVFLLFILGFLAGIYPAFFASKFTITDAVKGFRNPHSTAGKLRKGLVILQFIISVFLIFFTIGVYRQMEFFRNTNLGINKDHVVVMSMSEEVGNIALNDPHSFKAELMENPRIKNVALASNIMGDRMSVERLGPDGVNIDSDTRQMRFFRTDKDFIELMEIDIIEGGNFTNTKGGVEFLINEETREILDQENPVNLTANDSWGNSGKIVGVIKNFHFASLHNTIEPLVIESYENFPLKNNTIPYIYIKIDGKNIPETMDYLEKKLQEISATYSFDYVFLDQRMDSLYKNEEKISIIFRSFSIFAIFISCLGLFGISAFESQMKFKEIGIRKTLGAGSLKTAVSFAGHFFKLIIISLVISLPLSGYALYTWLEKFAYRINIGWIEFMIVSAAVILIALITVSYQTIRVSRLNPVDYLKYE